MVYKTAKCRVRSGNTLRTSNDRDSHMYRRQSYLIRNSTGDRNATILEDLGFDRDDVAYSLNKKGRWLVPQILKHEFINSEDNIKMDLVESHKLKRKTKCTGFHSNDGFLRKVLPKNTYFNSGSLKCKPSAPTVTVNIVTPCPPTSSLAHNPKYIDYSPTPMGKCDASKTSRKESNPPKSRTNTRRREMVVTMDDYHDEYDYSENEDDDTDPDDGTYKRPNTVYVGDILVHSNDMQALLFRELNTSNTGGALWGPYNPQPLAEEPEQKECGETEEHSTNSFTSMVRHTTVCIPNTEVLTGHLEELFGDDYSECRCFPRKFVIDITEKVTNTISKSKAFRNIDMKRLDLSAVLVFSYDMFGSLDSTDTDSFKVSINMKTTQQCRQMDALPESGVFGIEEIVQDAVSYIESIPYENFVSKNIPSSRTRPANTNHNILKLCETEVTVFTPENITIQDILKESKKTRHEGNASFDFESLPPDACSICFESIMDSPATALQNCGHWFCDRCWNDHLLATAKGSTGRITCPEYKCQSPVDYDILLTTSNLQIVEGMVRRRIHMDTDKDPNCKWCPNKKCGRVIKYDKNETGQIINVTCECGTEFCFDCLQSVHWPLSCRDHDKYLEKLKEYGHIDKATKPDEVFTFTVRGKQCPVCKVFMEKDGGCFTITCICGTQFCWGCRKLYDSHTPGTCYYGDMYDMTGDNYGTRTKMFVQHMNDGLTRDTPDWYKRAVLIRSSRNPSKVKVMSSAVRTMCRTLTSYKRRHGYVISAELDNFDVPGSHKHTPTTDKVHPFLAGMISVYLEASHLCEYTTVFLEKSRDQDLTQIRDCLQRLTEEIHSVFSVSNNLDLTVSISRLFYLRLECEKTMEALGNTMQ